MKWHTGVERVRSELGGLAELMLGPPNIPRETSTTVTLKLHLNILLVLNSFAKHLYPNMNTLHKDSHPNASAVAFVPCTPSLVFTKHISQLHLPYAPNLSLILHLITRQAKSSCSTLGFLPLSSLPS